jgi:uncharacterized protein (DUF433 family)
MSKEFVEERQGSFYLAGSRVPLAHVARQFQQGEPAESIRLHYPTLSLEQVYGAVAFYLGHKNLVEAEIVEREFQEDAYRAEHPMPPEVRENFERMRQQMDARQG